MFGGAHFDVESLRHYFVQEYLWSFDLDRLEWSALTSLTMPRPTYFHAAAMNEVKSMLYLFLAHQTIVANVHILAWRNLGSRWSCDEH